MLKLVKEKSSYEPSELVKNLEKDLGFKIKTVQTDNGREFCNDREEKKSIFEKTLEALEIEHIRTRPYSPWQNGLVERSHKMDNDLFYSKRRFSSEEEMYKAFQRYSGRTNNIARRILNFKTPNEMVQTYFMKEA
ncbi:integrase core domain-containing protein [Peptococcus simiae]|uniref:integrase core domain-containing protein n=1 Tax=Peptococcus simiae TaxID=1643805 RepID=UPI00397EC1F3